MDKERLILLEKTAKECCRGKGMSASYFLWRIFCAMRENRELLLEPDGQRLYDEVLEFLFHRYGEARIEKETQKSRIEFLCDLHCKHSAFPFEEKLSASHVRSFLEACQKNWALT